MQDELRRSLRDPGKYTITGQTAEARSEKRVEGRYYGKRVDVSVESGDRILAVVSVKFILSSYRKNAIHYLEQQIGETANLRRQNIVYGNLFFLTNPIPSGTKEERLTPKDIARYLKLRQDHEHLHSPINSPDEMAIGLVEWTPSNVRCSVGPDPRICRSTTRRGRRSTKSSASNDSSPGWRCGSG